jgi:hypothetical protein
MVDDARAAVVRLAVVDEAAVVREPDPMPYAKGADDDERRDVVIRDAGDEAAAPGDDVASGEEVGRRTAAAAGAGSPDGELADLVRRAE